MNGQDPPAPKVPAAYETFHAQLKAAGINPVRTGTRTRLTAMTDDATRQLAGDRVVTQPRTVRWGQDRMTPIDGGLFDPRLFGDVSDPDNPPRWARIDLPEPVINPVFEDPVRALLGLKKAQLSDVVAGRAPAPGQEIGGGEGLRRALAQFDDVDAAVARETRTFREGRTLAERDLAAKRLGYLQGLQRQGIAATDYLVTSVPVMPPQYRPIGKLPGSEIPTVADPNYLYAQLLDSARHLSDAKRDLGDDGADVERAAVYRSLRELTGLDEPADQVLKAQGVRGVLGSVFGESAKTGAVQYRLLGGNVDQVGRAGALRWRSAGVPRSGRRSA